MKRRIGILTSGGDCPGLNAAIRGVTRAAYEMFDAEIIGIHDGYRGLIEGDYQEMKRSDFSGILTLGGTILGTARTPFRNMRVIGDDKVDKVAAMKKTYKDLKLDCLVTLGGNGTHKTANLLSEEGLNVIGLPKTIDNDLYGTDFTFGFHTAMDIATEVVDRIHTTAASDGRCMVIEIMGNKAGWLTLYSGVAGGADVILIPEIPYDINKVAQTVMERQRRGKKFSIVACAEGAVSADMKRLSEEESRKLKEQKNHPAVSYEIAEQLEKLTGQEIRVTIPGHYQRGGPPCPYDRILATQFGTAAADLIINKQYGRMVAIQSGEIVSIPLEEAASKTKFLPTDHPMIQVARDMGVSLGD